MTNPLKLKYTFRTTFKREPTCQIYAPGRIVLLGAHIDYSDGWVMPAAINRGVSLLMAPTEDRIVTIYSQNFQQQAQFSLKNPQPEDKQSLTSNPQSPSWLKYPQAVAASLAESGHDLVGMDVLIDSDLPMGAGLGSSAALEMAFVLAWEAAGGFVLDNITRAQIGQRAENAYLNVSSGMMDQMASVASRADHLLYVDCRTMQAEYAPLPQATAVILADSGVRRELAKINYNSRPAECRQATQHLQQYLPGIRTLRDVSPADFAKYKPILSPVLQQRAQHVIGEIQRVHQGVAALRQGDVAIFGRLMTESQQSSRDNYENSTLELDFLAETAVSQPGVYGARFAGGGFGGFMQVLVDETEATRVQRTLTTFFKKKFNRILPTYRCQIVHGANLS